MATKLSCDWPNTLPLALATPMTSKGVPSMPIDFPMGSVLGKKRSLKSGAEEDHVQVAAVLDVGEEAAAVICELVMTAQLEVAPITWTPSTRSVPYVSFRRG